MKWMKIENDETRGENAQVAQNVHVVCSNIEKSIKRSFFIWKSSNFIFKKIFFYEIFTKKNKFVHSRFFFEKKSILGTVFTFRDDRFESYFSHFWNVENRIFHVLLKRSNEKSKKTTFFEKIGRWLSHISWKIDFSICLISLYIILKKLKKTKFSSKKNFLVLANAFFLKNFTKKTKKNRKKRKKHDFIQTQRNGFHVFGTFLHFFDTFSTNFLSLFGVFPCLKKFEKKRKFFWILSMKKKFFMFWTD